MDAQLRKAACCEIGGGTHAEVGTVDMRMVLPERVVFHPAAQDGRVQIAGVGLHSSQNDVGSCVGQPNLPDNPVTGNGGVGVGVGQPRRLGTSRAKRFQSCRNTNRPAGPGAPQTNLQSFEA